MTRWLGRGTAITGNAGLTLAMLVALAAFFTLQGQFLALARREPLGAWSVLATHVATQLRLVLPWAILVPTIGHLARLAEPGRIRWPATIAVHTAACALAGVAVTVFYQMTSPYVLRWFGGNPEGPFVETFAKLFRVNALTYFLVLGFWTLVDAYRRLRERERAAAALEVRLAQAQLQVLAAQVQPHFLFNALHAVSSLVHTDPDEADRVIGELSDLLRASLRGSARQEVPLRSELETLQHYLAILNVRFKDRLQIRITAPPETLDALVPSFILQPLVENAVKHGAGALEDGGSIDIDARRDHDRLVVQVRDTGTGFVEPASALRDGHGLASLRERLRLLHGRAATLSLDNRRAGGAVVTIALPWSTGRDAEARAGRTP